MAAIVSRALRAPRTLAWWEWPKLAGGLMLLGLLVCGCRVSPLVLGLALHVACDFTFQSDIVAMRKGERGRYLLLHALAAGGLPGVMAGLMAGNPLAGLLVGVVSHCAIDWTRKFGVKSVAWGVVLDQAAHVAVLALIAGV